MKTKIFLITKIMFSFFLYATAFYLMDLGFELGIAVAILFITGSHIQNLD